MFKKATTETGIAIEHVEHRVYNFLKQDGRWYIDLPEYLEQGGSKRDLEVIAGADEMLNAMARGKKKVTLELDREGFEGADLLELIELCEAPKGGGYYMLHTFGGREIRRRMWLCDVVLCVFGDMPERIFVKRLDFRQHIQKQSLSN